jgi:hypothetical protein
MKFTIFFIQTFQLVTKMLSKCPQRQENSAELLRAIFKFFVAIDVYGDRPTIIAKVQIIWKKDDHI